LKECSREPREEPEERPPRPGDLKTAKALKAH
jgi:hypothetical protein